MMVAVVMFVNHLSHYRRQWQLSLPQLHSAVIVSSYDLPSRVANQVCVLPVGEGIRAVQLLCCFSQ